MSVVFLCKVFAILSVIGLIVMFPLREHWARIFGPMDVMIVLGAAVAVFFIANRFFFDPEPLQRMELINGSVIGIGSVLVGLGTLIKCMGRCGSVLEMILLPILMVMLFGAFVLILLLTMFAVFGMPGEHRVVIWHED